MFAQPAPEKIEISAKKVPNPSDVVKLALLDLQAIPSDDRPFQRYIYTRDNSKEFHGAFNYVLNTCLSHASTLYRPTVVANGYLIRIDLKRVWPRSKDYARFFPIYEELSLIDPYFHTTGEITEEITTQVKVTIPRKVVNGKYVTSEMQDRVTTQTTTSTEHALHLAGHEGTDAAIGTLAAELATQTPILRADWLIVTLTTSNSKQNGRYHQFRGFAKSTETKSAEQAWLESMGLDYENIKNELRSDQRIGKWRSMITGKPRAVEYVYTPGVRATLGPIVVTMTRDYFTGKIKAKDHPIKNLLNYKHDGTEAIGPLPNGMLSFLLFDAKGSLIEVAPAELVSDRTVPAPHPTDLQGPISCIRCHGPTEMWMDTKNDVMAFTKGNLGVNIFDDESNENLTPEEALDRIAGLYTGELEEPIRISRNTHSKATFIVSGGMEIPEVAKKIADIYEEYRYDPVTPEVACRELGYEVSAEQAATVFDAIIPTLPPNRHGVHPETVTIATLRAWTKTTPLYVNRDDWEQEYADAMLRTIMAEITTK